MKKKIEDLTFIDDGMFQAVMREPGISEEIVERLLHVKVDKVIYPELEKPIKPFYTTKGVRLDVYLKDTDKIIDVELQTYKHDAIGKRTRYYQSMIDIDSLMKGQDYTELLDSYVLFMQGFGLPCYTFRNTCAESSAVSLDDKAVKVIYNASAYEKVEDKKIRDFLHFVMTNDPAENDFFKKVSDTVERLKENEKFRSDYAAMNLHDRDIMKIAREEGMTIGIAQGQEQKAIEDAERMLRKEYPIEDISEITGLPIEKVLELQKELTPSPE